MAIFSRRRLQNMLDVVGAQSTAEQANDILNRLENRSEKSSLAAEIELGLLFTLSQVAHVQLHPELETTKRRPEAYSQNLFSSGPAFIEVTALSDDTFSDKDKMERAANIITQFSERTRSNARQHLHFSFREKSGYESGKFRRYRLISSNFQLTPKIEVELNDWLRRNDWPTPRAIRLTDDNIDVVIEWRKSVHPEGRTYSSMPALAYDLEDNPVYKALQKKRSQLAGAPDTALKCIFLGDAGCTVLRDLRPMYSGPGAVSGEQIIRHFLLKTKVDVVAVFSAQRASNYDLRSPRIWKVTIFEGRQTWPVDEHAKLQQLARSLPSPMYEAYQARSLHRQGSFAPQARGQYLGTYMTSSNMTHTSIKFSARLFQELIAGRITTETFNHFSKVSDLFDGQLTHGNVIKSARIEPAGIDEDDDYLVVEFEPDPSASPLATRRETS